MHIHPNNNLLLATLGAGREDVQQVHARRAAEVRRKLSAASRVSEFAEDETSGASRVEARSYDAEEQQQGEDDSFGRLFSATA